MNEENTNTAVFYIALCYTKLAERNGNFIVVVHCCTVMALCIKVYPIGRITAHIADYTIIIFAISTVDTPNLFAEYALACFVYNTGGCGISKFYRIYSCAVAAINIRTVFTNT